MKASRARFTKLRVASEDQENGEKIECVFAGSELAFRVERAKITVKLMDCVSTRAASLELANGKHGTRRPRLDGDLAFVFASSRFVL